MMSSLYTKGNFPDWILKCPPSVSKRMSSLLGRQLTSLHTSSVVWAREDAARKQNAYMACSPASFRSLIISSRRYRVQFLEEVIAVFGFADVLGGFAGQLQVGIRLLLILGERVRPGHRFIAESQIEIADFVVQANLQAPLPMNQRRM